MFKSKEKTRHAVSQLIGKGKQRGLSLIELMIAMVLGLILIAGVMQIFLSGRQVFASHQSISRIQETGRLAMEFMSRDLRMAGYMGCASRNRLAVINSATTASGLHRDYHVGFRAYTSGQLSPLGVSFSSGGNTLTPEGDVLVIRSADNVIAPVTTANTPTMLTIRAPAVDSSNCSGGICANGAVAVADCNKIRVFTPDTVSNGAAGTVEVTHQAWPELEETLKSFGPDAEMMAINTTAYFVADRSLWQWSSNGNRTDQLLEGVERMVATYGVDTDDDGIPDDYVVSSLVGSSEDDWRRVYSVRIELLVVSAEDNVISEAQTYTFNGAEITAPDRRLRQVFINTVGIRSRLP